MSLQRTGDFVAIKTRSLQWENADGSTPATGSVLAATATGGTRWTREPELDTVTARESIVLIDGEAAGTLTYQAGAGLRLNGAAINGSGATGPMGPTGPNGSVGSQGVTGPTGRQGDQGIQGPTGNKGDQGIQGPTGTKGDQGIQGPTGNKGDQGVAGVTGPTGAPGVLTSISGVTGTYTNPTSITVNAYGQVTNVVQAGGPAGLVGDSGTYSYPTSITVDDGLVTAVGTAGNIVQSVAAGDSSITVTGGGTPAPQISLPTVYTGSNPITYPTSISVDTRGRVTASVSGSQPLTALSAGTGISISGSGGSRTIGFNPNADVNLRTVTLSDGLTVSGTSLISGTTTFNGPTTTLNGTVTLQNGFGFPVGGAVRIVNTTIAGGSDMINTNVYSTRKRPDLGEVKDGMYFCNIFELGNLIPSIAPRPNVACFQQVYKYTLSDGSTKCSFVHVSTDTKGGGVGNWTYVSSDDSLRIGDLDVTYNYRVIIFYVEF